MCTRRHPVAPLIALALVACGAPPEFEAVVQAEPASFGEVSHGLGAPCVCEGEACSTFGVPQPNRGAILGCAEVPASYGGGQKVCLRSYVGERANPTYFANGYCALMATQCEGSSLICSNARFGDHAAMTRCPPGSVRIEATEHVRVELGLLGTHTATLQTRICAAACQDDSACRVGEYDPVLDAPGQYQCVLEDGVGCCYDPRSLSPEHALTAF
jgi:hypothetical protein